MKNTLILLLALAGQALSADETLTTRLGRKYEKVTVLKTSAFELSISHADGVARIPLADLPEDWQKRCNYDPEKAAKAKELKELADAVLKLADAVEESEKPAAPIPKTSVPAAPAFNAKAYGDLFVESGLQPGIRSLTVGKKTYSKVQIKGRDADGMIRLSTQQGEVIVGQSEVPQDWLTAIAAKEAGTDKKRLAAERKILSINEELKARAADEWPNDYAMQKYEFDRQKRAWDEMRTYAGEEWMADVVAKARKEWKDDYVMQVYEVKRQLTAKQALQRTK